MFQTDGSMAPLPEYVAPQAVLAGEYQTFADVLSAAASTFPQQDAYVEGARRLSFGEWHAQAIGLATALRAKGVQPGDVVLIWIESSIEFALCYAAALYAGAIASGVNLRLGKSEVDGIVQRCSPRVVIMEDGGASSIEGTEIIRRREIAGLCETPVRGVPVDRRSSDPAVIIWTSGTTGHPKGAVFDHDNLRSAVATTGPMGAPFGRRLGSTPFAHAGYMSKVYEQVAFGVAVIICPVPWRAVDTLRLIVEERISIVPAVPTQWAKMLELPELAAADLSHVKVAISATAPAAPELIERVMARFGCPLIVRYSMTECPSISGTVPGEGPDVLSRTVGKPQRGMLVRLVDEAGSAVPQSEIGRICVRGPAVMRCYWGDPAQTAQVLSDDGWLTTSDCARFDSDGNLIIAGRLGEMYIRGGYNVYPIEVERVLAAHPAIAAVAIVGKSAPVIGEIGVAFVVAADSSAPPGLEDLRSLVKANLADYKAPDELVLLQQLPQTAMMKIDKAALKARLLTS